MLYNMMLLDIILYDMANSVFKINNGKIYFQINVEFAYIYKLNKQYGNPITWFNIILHSIV